MKVLMNCMVEEEYQAIQGLEEPLVGEGYEVAYFSPNPTLIMTLANDKKLVVKPDTYDYDFIITMQDVWVPKGKYIIYEGQELVELFQEIDNVITESISSNNNI